MRSSTLRKDQNEQGSAAPTWSYRKHTKRPNVIGARRRMQMHPEMVLGGHRKETNISR